MEKKYPKIEEVLPIGKHIISVKPMPEFKDKKPVQGTQKKGVSSFGNWYLYQTKVGDKYISLFANDENKTWFDTGTVEVNVVHKIDKGTKEPIWKVIDEKPVKVLKAFINEVKEAQVAECQDVTDDAGNKIF